MSDRLTSFLILLGVALLVLLLWYLSILSVRKDTLRHGMNERQRQMWVILAVALPLFGFALYLFLHVLRRYFTPEQDVEPGNSRATQVKRPPAGSHSPAEWGELQEYPLPEPAWGSQNKPGKNGKSTNGKTHLTPATIPAAYQALRTHYAVVITQGPLLGKQFDLKTLPARIGRGPEVDIPLDADLNVSRRQAEIYEWNGMLRIRDLGSTHGTQINGLPAADQALSPGDHVTVGGTTFILRELH